VRRIEVDQPQPDDVAGLEPTVEDWIRTGSPPTPTISR